MSLFKNNTIRKRVIAVIEDKINSAQKECDEEFRKIDENVVEKMKEITEKAISEREEVQERLINNILGKII